jgi:hypothetical protein
MTDTNIIFKDIATTLKNLITFNERTSRRLEKVERYLFDLSIKESKCKCGDRNESKK